MFITLRLRNIYIDNYKNKYLLIFSIVIWWMVRTGFCGSTSNFFNYGSNIQYSCNNKIAISYAKKGKLSENEYFSKDNFHAKHF